MVKSLFGAILVVYMVMSILALAAGAGSATYKCRFKPVRIEKFFPSYTLGCYLFGEVD